MQFDGRRLIALGGKNNIIIKNEVDLMKTLQHESYTNQLADKGINLHTLLSRDFQVVHLTHLASVLVRQRGGWMSFVLANLERACL